MDYKSTSGALKFAPGETRKTISVPVFGDNIDEVNETFFLNLSNPNSATILNGQATDLIIDDDGPVVSINNVSGLEGNSGTTPFNFTLSLSAPSVQTIVVYIATADGTATGGNPPFTRDNGLRISW